MFLSPRLLLGVLLLLLSHAPWAHAGPTCGFGACPPGNPSSYVLPARPIVVKWQCSPDLVTQVAQLEDVNGDALIDLVWAFSNDCGGCSAQNNCVCESWPPLCSAFARVCGVARLPSPGLRRPEHRQGLGSVH